MNKIDIEKLEDITREIIETLEEEMPDDSSGLLCAKNRGSPFGQLIGLLEMEMASIKIMYSDEPLPVSEAEEFPAQEPAEFAKPIESTQPAKSEQPTKSPIATVPEMFTEKTVDKPGSGKPREPITIAEKPGTITHIHRAKQPPLPQTATEFSTKNQHVKSQTKKSPTTKILLAATSLLLLLLIGYWLFKQGTPIAPLAKIVVNWSDVEQGKTHADHFKNKVDPKKKKSAKSFYAMGTKERDNNNLKAAREYFRTAVSLDPSTQEYMDAFRQADHTLRKNKERRRP